MLDFEFDTDLLALLPPWYREILDYQQICNAESQQFEALAASIRGVTDNLFVSTMDAGAIAQWEQILKIVADTETESLEFRRERVINRISTQPPFTVWFLRQKLDELIGVGQWEISVDYPNYTLTVESSALDQSYAQEVAVTIGHVKPAHIVYVNTPYFHYGLLLNEEIISSAAVWNYRLGSWGLGVKPFRSVSDEGVIKMPSVRSIQNRLLTDAAGFVESDIVAARINGNTVISAIEKTVSGNTVTVFYEVPASVGTSITQVELLDSSNNPLTSASVYIPVTTETSIKHVIKTQEGVAANG